MTTYEIIVTIIMIIFGGFSYYYKTKSKLSESANELVTIAENKYAEFEKSGSKKLEFCVNYLYSYVPTPVKAFFPKSALEVIVETALANMKEFAKTQVDTLNKKAESAMDELVDKLINISEK